MDELDTLEEIFLKYLTQDSPHHDRRRRDFNQAIFNAERGHAIWTQTDLDMVMEKFHKAVREFREEIGIAEPRLTKALRQIARMDASDAEDYAVQVAQEALRIPRYSAVFDPRAEHGD